MAVQGAQRAQTRSETRVGETDWYVDPVEHVVRREHRRSDVLVAATDWYSKEEQVVKVMQTRSDVGVDATV